MSLLRPRRTTQRVVLLLTEAWWHTRYESLFSKLGAHVQRTPEVKNVGCSGPFRKGNHFIGSYTHSAAWGLSALCDSVVAMDSDLQVIRSMDHVFDFMGLRLDWGLSFWW